MTISVGKLQYFANVYSEKAEALFHRVCFDVISLKDNIKITISIYKKN